MAIELGAFIESSVGGHDVPFEPYCDLDREANALVIFCRPDTYFSKLLTESITLYLAMDDPRQVVACRIDGIANLLATPN